MQTFCSAAMLCNFFFQIASSKRELLKITLLFLPSSWKLLKNCYIYIVDQKIDSVHSQVLLEKNLTTEISFFKKKFLQFGAPHIDLMLNEIMQDSNFFSSQTVLQYLCAEILEEGATKVRRTEGQTDIKVTILIQLLTFSTMESQSL